jgi:hypothetical protein
MSDAYSKDLRKLALDISHELDYTNFVREGVYCMVSGPNFETIAEARMLQVLGCDSVGEWRQHRPTGYNHKRVFITRIGYDLSNKLQLMLGNGSI